MNLADFDALTFDCYGTLIDWERGILEILRPWADRNGLTVADEQLLAVFARAEAEVESRPPFRAYTEILRLVMAEIASAFGLTASLSECDEFADSVGGWPPFPDTVAALRELRDRYRLIVVSNVDHRSFSATQRLLGSPFHAAVLAEDVGAYKPDHAMFHRAVETAADLGVSRERILHVAQSLYHDHVPAAALGIPSVWVDRRAGRPGGATKTPDRAVHPALTVSSMAELVEQIRADRARKA